MCTTIQGRKIKAAVLLIASLSFFVPALLAFPAIADATIERRTRTTTGATTTIRVDSSRSANVATDRPIGSGTSTTRNANSNGIRARISISNNINGRRVTDTSAWSERRATVVTGRLATGASTSTAQRRSATRNGWFEAEGQRRALATSAWTASGTISAATAW